MEVVRSETRTWENGNQKKIRRTVTTSTSFYEFQFRFLEEDLPLMQFVRITDSIEAHRSVSTPINPTEESVRSFTNNLIEKLESETAVEEVVAEVEEWQ